MENRATLERGMKETSGFTGNSRGEKTRRREEGKNIQTEGKGKKKGELCLGGGHACLARISHNLN